MKTSLSKILLFICMFFCISQIHVYAMSVEYVNKAEFDRLQIIPGIITKAYVPFNPKGISWKAQKIDISKTIENEDNVSVISVAIDRNAGTPVYIVEFIVWKTGKHIIPGFSIADFDFPSIPIECSYSQSIDNFQIEMLDQMNPPGLALVIYIIAFCIFIFVFILMFGKRILLPMIKSLFADYYYRKTRRVFDIVCNKLIKKQKELESNAMWTEFVQAFRKYTSSRIGFDIYAMTSKEIIEFDVTKIELKKPCEKVIRTELKNEIAKIISIVDEVRFSGKANYIFIDIVKKTQDLADKIDIVQSKKYNDDIHSTIDFTDKNLSIAKRRRV